MGVMSIREFNKNASAAFAKVVAGETLEISKNGKVFGRAGDFPRLGQACCPSPHWAGSRRCWARSC